MSLDTNMKELMARQSDVFFDTGCTVQFSLLLFVVLKNVVISKQ